MILNPKTCKRNGKILCGIVNNLGNCPFPTNELCEANNSTNLLGMVSNTFGTITLKLFRYDHHKIKFKVLDENMCNECKIIWADKDDNCLICNLEE